MSTIGRLTSQHLDDAVFAELWTNAIADQAPVAPHPHLLECAECRLRLASFHGWLEELRVHGIAEADTAISAERLAAQQAQVLRRLEAAERPARVIAFPKAPVGAERPIAVRRWILGAAAAGLIAGIGLGQLLDLRHLSSGPAPSSFERMADAGAIPQPSAVVPAAATVNEEIDLAELEAASIPRYEALRAYDNFTPRAADFVRTSR